MPERLNVFLGVVGAKVSKTATAMKRWIRVEMRWKRKALSRWSSVCLVMRLPKSHKKCSSLPRWTLPWSRHKQVWLSMSIAFARLPVCCGLCCCARGLGRRGDVRRRYHVQYRYIPCNALPSPPRQLPDPSGRLPWVLSRSDGSFMAGMSALDSARHSRSFKAWCPADRPVPPLQERPCSHLPSTDAPQGTGGAHICRPLAWDPRRWGWLYRPAWGHMLTTGGPAAAVTAVWRRHRQQLCLVHCASECLHQWCSPQDQDLGLEAPRGQKWKSWSWSWIMKSWSWSWTFGLGLRLGLAEKVLQFFKALL